LGPSKPEKAVTPTDARRCLDEGVVHWRARRYEAALRCFDRALAIDPEYADALFNRGLTLRKLGRPGEAIESFARSVCLQPRPGAYVVLGDTLQAAERRAEAVEAYDAALTIDPGHEEGHLARVRALRGLRRFDRALDACRLALNLVPDKAAVLHARGRILLALRRMDEAMADFTQAAALRPDLAEAYIDWGLVLKFLGRPDQEAWLTMRKGVALNNDVLKQYVIKAAAELIAGEYEIGFVTYEVRLHYAQFCRDHGITAPIWLGESDISGKTILVNAELGFGDTIQFCRYVPMLEQAGAKVLFSPQRALRGLMRTLGDRVEIVDVGTDALTFDRHCRVISLAAAFRTSVETVPAAAPYLAAEPDRVARWRARIGGQDFKIGICWRGSQDGTAAGRSIPLTAFAGVAAIPGVRLISLQKGEGASELDSIGGRFSVETLGDDFDAGDEAFLDAAAVIKACDLVISCDTSIAHLAGALGRPVWLALHPTACWRWMKDRSDTPWYPSARLFRQKTPGGWDEAFAEIEAALREIAA